MDEVKKGMEIIFLLGLIEPGIQYYLDLSGTYLIESMENVIVTCNLLLE